MLFLSPWGIEEMCNRKLYRILSERFAALGVASLRFDYPGAANAFDAEGDGAELAESELAESDLAGWISTTSAWTRSRSVSATAISICPAPSTTAA